MNTITTDKVLVGGIEIRVTRDGQSVTLEEAAQALAEAQASIVRTLQDLRGGKAEDAPHVTTDAFRAFKAGDVVSFEHVDAKGVTAIFKTYNEDDACIGFYCAIAQDGNLTYNTAYENIVDITKIRLATDDERKRLTGALRDERCLMWSDEANSLVRWKAAHLGNYYTMDHSCLQVIKASDDSDDMDSRDVDSNRYTLGNYYPTREMAERQAERIRAIHATPCTDTTFTGR